MKTVEGKTKFLGYGGAIMAPRKKKLRWYVKIWKWMKRR